MTDISGPSAIKNYNLFGEPGDLPDVVHCETIERRSTLHNWEFVPHRHARLHQILLIEEGGGQAALDGSTIAITPGMVINVPIGSVHAFSFHPGTQGWVVTLAAEIMDEALQDHEGLRPMLDRACHVSATGETTRLMEWIFREFSGRGFARAHVLRSLSGLLVGLVARHVAASSAAAATIRDTPLQRRFEALVDAHFLKHWSVADYARALAVTPTHLSRVSRRTTGLPASRIIEERLVREARRLLTYTNITVTQIAYELGYIDPAYFSRVFSRATGLSPRRFRMLAAASA